MLDRRSWARLACRTSAIALAALLPFAALPAEASSLQTFTFGNDDDVEFHLSGDGNWLVYSDEPDGRAVSSSLVGASGSEPVAGKATGISFDGSVIVGTGADGYAFLLKNNVTTEIGDFTDSSAQAGHGSSANAVSRDGKVVIGTASTDDGRTAFRWTNGVLTDLGALPGGTDSNPTVLSADGSVIAGDSRVSGDSTAYVWSTTNPVATALGSIGGPGSYANAISADGSTIVGRGDIGGPYIHAYRWTAGSGMVDLGTFAGGNDSEALAVSADGTVVAGWAENAPGFTEAFRWTQADGLVALGSLGPDLQSRAYAMSDDGADIVGISDTSDGETGFHWDQQQGMVSIADYLSDAGLDVAGWTFNDVEQISADGLSMAGQGGDSVHFNGIWYARCDWNTQCALISDGNAADSFAGLADLGGGPAAALEGDFSELGSALDNAGSGPSASLYGGLDSDPSASLGVVISDRLSAALVGALGLGTTRIDTPLAFGGGASFDAASLSASLGLVPDEGLTARVGISGLDLSGTVTRGYLNGNVAAQSTGDTGGWSAGLDALLGWRFADALPATSLLVYGELGVSRTSYDGWTETGGPFPATIAGFTVDTTSLRAGLEASHSFGTVAATARAAFVHQQTSGSPIAGTIIGAFGSEVDPATGAADWLELGGGLDIPTGAAGRTSLDVTARLPTSGSASVTGQVGLHLPL